MPHPLNHNSPFPHLIPSPWQPHSMSLSLWIWVF
jgi:hypothetical protein